MVRQRLSSDYIGLARLGGAIAKWAWAAVFLALVVGCGSDSGSSPALQELTRVGRRVYQGDMEGRKGLLFFAASDSAMIAVYDTVRCGLYMAWKGPLLGPARDGAGFYVPQGPLYVVRDDARFWTVLIGGDTVAATIHTTGFDEDSTGYLVFHYRLDLPGGQSVHIDESPLHDDHYGDHALLRTFHITGLDTATTVRLKLGGLHKTWNELWSQSASGTLEGGPGEQVLVLREDGVSQVKVTWVGSSDI